MSKKRKIDAQGRPFQDRWEGEYMFVLQKEKPVCLLCYEAVSVVKEYNLRSHFDTKHGAKYAKFSLQEKQQKGLFNNMCEGVVQFILHYI